MTSSNTGFLLQYSLDASKMNPWPREFNTDEISGASCASGNTNSPSIIQTCVIKLLIK